MAQPVFDDHPLEEYFRQTGETSEPMPGSSPEFVADPDDNLHATFVLSISPDKMPSFIVKALQIIDSCLSTRPCSERDFAERFKYDVISSSLLSSSISSQASGTRRSFSPDLPGRLDSTSSERSVSLSDPGPPDGRLAEPVSPSSDLLGDYFWLFTLASSAVVLVSSGWYLFAMLLFAFASYSWHCHKLSLLKTDELTSTLNSVKELISAGNTWDSAVNDAITIIEKEERSIFYGPSSPQSPSTALRVALQSSLHTTQIQCDNVRHLLAALTAPTQLAQLTEMYAPASPLKPTFTLLDNPRPLSIPAWRQRTTSVPLNKRATWNGSYAALALAGSPTAHLNRRSRNRRSDMSSLFETSASRTTPISAPSTPITSLQNVQEESSAIAPGDLPREYFGVAALGLQRKRKSMGLETLGFPTAVFPTAEDAPAPSTPSGSKAVRMSSPPQVPSSTRLTSVHTTRHPLSLSGLHLALHGALSAKRYACAHLLALRFEEGEDDAYWEDVRSVIALLTSTLDDASARLLDALGEVQRVRARDERPSPESLAASRAGSESPSSRGVTPPRSSRQARTMAEMASFAPMPSHLTRFAAHVDAISSALNDARDHLEQCVAALREPETETDRKAPVEGASPSNSDSVARDATSVQEHPAFLAYDRLRKELGFALRECERGRERLLDIIAQPAPAAEEPDDTPPLGQDTGSDTSERIGPASPALQPPEDFAPSAEQPGSLGLNFADSREDADLDDVTAHLLLTASSSHLPAPGVEQVFEADTNGAAPFVRERPKLSREERIRLAKERRESGVRGSALLAEPPSALAGERWGPGGEVVQELKDVIWKVGERRRTMTTARTEPPPAADDTLRTGSPRMADIDMTS
ncbi:hypothetical protein CERSUDRAFT_112985 [Gelatoporia subvermispora B]|uniref:Myosin-binding domain-containing protein n=1 Tax=Ceriporiopsis subvermispora (strain B) TaxID=914234 RepID=M2R477_CERS8|nr:hypothetical protein CERSUDRAFT_112985 [Gelatoporia subvermispora B]